MRLILGLVIGLLVGAGAMIWFFAYGGEIIVAGKTLGPPKAEVAAVTSPAAPTKPRVVVRDITSEPAASSGSGTPSSTPPPAKTSPPPADAFVLGNSLVVIVWPKW